MWLRPQRGDFVLPELLPTTNGLSDFAIAFLDYLDDREKDRALVAKHAETTAIHTKGKDLQLYRLFDATAEVADYIRIGAEKLPSWEQSIFANPDLPRWEKQMHQVNQRMAKHQKLLPIVTRGVTMGIPILIHAYKFEPDPILKVELIAVPHRTPAPLLPLQTMAALLSCHEFLVPDGVAKALPPYTRHEAEFVMMWDYLSQTMPKGLYASQCLPSNRVASPVPSGGTLPQHQLECGEPECHP